MLISEFHNKFKVALDKIDSLNYPDILPEEIDSFLNTNILKFISQRMYGNNIRKEGIEETQKRFDDLLPLVTNANIIPNPNTIDNKVNGQSVVLPADYWHLIEEEVGISYLDCNGITIKKTVPIYPVTHDKYNKVIRDPFNKPNTDKVIRMGLTGQIELIVGTGVTINQYVLRYIRKPAQVQFGSTYAIPAPDIQCDLSESVHEEIVAMSVQDALEKIESRRWQTEKIENSNIE